MTHDRKRTLRMRELVALVDDARADVQHWFDIRDTRQGREILSAARATHREMSIAMGGGQHPYYLTPQASSVKLTHNAHITEWEQVVAYLSAHRLSGLVNMCPDSTPECRAGCLEDSGHLAMEHAKVAMRCRTRMLVEETAAALIIILAETERHARRVHACGKYLAQRLNGTSDVPWEQVAWFLAMLREVGVDQHFDYTKSHGRVSTPDYYLAPSATERTRAETLRPGMVVVVDAKRGDALPTTYHGLPVIDGDHENGDLRFLDQRRPDAVVLLRAKGHLQGVPGRVDGFVKPVETLVSITRKVA